MLTLGALALALMATSGQQASAWTKFSIGAGIHFGREAADVSILKGLWRNGPHPSAHAHGQGGYGYGGYGHGGYGGGYGGWHGNAGPGAPGAPGLNKPDHGIPAFGAPPAPAVPGLAAPQGTMPYATGSIGSPMPVGPAVTAPGQLQISQGSGEAGISNASYWVPVE
jgi:hypothetical protein